MDKKIAHNVILGIFVAVGFIGFLFVLFSVGDGKGIFSSQYTLYGKFAHVKGLHSGSEVSLSGLRIGVVKNIQVSEDSSELVAVFSIASRFQNKIREDSLATIRTQGVLGDKYIEISMGSPESPILKHKSVIATSEPGDLFTKSGKVVDDISKRFDKGGDMDSLIKNLNKVAQNLAIISSDIQEQKTGEKFGKTLHHLESIFRKIDKGEGSLGALINDPTVYEDIKYLLGGAKRSTILKYFMNSFIDSGTDNKNPKK